MSYIVYVGMVVVVCLNSLGMQKAGWQQMIL